MRITILDDVFDTLRTLPCFRTLEGRSVDIWNDHVEEVDALAERSSNTAVPRSHPRAEIRRPLLERLDELRLISQRSVYPHIDIERAHALHVSPETVTRDWKFAKRMAAA